MSELSKENSILKIWVDGCFDMGHFGHVNLLRQAKEANILSGMKNYLVVGVHSDEEIKKHKRLPIFTQNEREEMLISCKYVDEVVTNAPYETTIDTLKEHECVFSVHGTDISTSSTGNDTYEEVKKAGMYIEVDRTEGISTTELIKRVLCDGNNQLSKGYTGKLVDDSYYLSLIKKIENKPNVIKKEGINTIVYVEGSFDLYHAGHVQFLKQIKSQGKYLIVNILDDLTVLELKGQGFPFMKMKERALTVMGCKYVDEVHIGGQRGAIPWEIRQKYKDIEMTNLDNIEYGFGANLDIYPKTEDIIKRIQRRREELIRKNAKKEEKEELAVRFVTSLKIM